ncbi:MAG: spore germination protein [Actinomycetia bacterium]|nr:spore germination protein [Actinomycetes bacterium]
MRIRRARAGWVRRRAADRKTQPAGLEYLKSELGYGVSFDVIVREFDLSGHPAALVYIDSFVDQTVLTLIMEELLKPEHAVQRADLENLKSLLVRRVPYIEIQRETNFERVRDQILAGPAALLVAGAQGALVLDVRKYPQRQPEEPTLERVIRGPRDGFIETLIENTIMVRRRIRDPHFRAEAFQVGSRAKTDVVMMYIGDIANEHFVKTIRERIQSIRVDGLTMSEKAMEEWIMKKPWWNLFPNAKFTERPDVAAEHLMQGHVLVMIDNSPNAIILPVTLFSFLQSAEEYHEGIVVGSYLKWVRNGAVLFSLIGPPLWYLFYAAHVALPGGWRVLVTPTTVGIPIIWQLLLVEVGVDILRLALMFTPNSLSQSMGFFGAILLGDIAIKAGLIDAEVMVYVAIAAVGTFSAPDFDFGMAVRVMRMFLLILVALANTFGLPWFGFVVGILVLMLMALRTDSLGIGYLWPLVPFDGPELLSLLSRKPLNRNIHRPGLTLPRDRFRQPAGGGRA